MINIITNNIEDYNKNINPAKEIFTKYIYALIQEQGNIAGIDENLLSEYISGFIDEKVKDYEIYQRYKGRGLKIFEKQKLDDRLVKANNQIHTPLRGIITDQKLGYMFGNAVKKESKDEKANEFLKEFFNETEMGVVETETAKYASVTGLGYILLFLDFKDDKKEKVFPFLSKMKPWEAEVLEYEDEAILGVRVYNTFNLMDKKEVTRVLLYDNFFTYTYEYNNGKIKEVEAPQKHGFQYIPLIPFRNNSDASGDWERAEALMDAYDSVLSRRQDAIEELADSLFVIEGCEIGDEPNLTETDRKMIRENGIMVIPGGGTGSYKSKTLDIAATDAQLKALRENIFRSCQAVDITDPAFGGNESGVARQLRFQELENKSKSTEASFILAYKRLFKVLNTYTSVYIQTPLHWKDISIEFTRNTSNLPTDVPELIRVLKEAVNSGFISKETALKKLPFIENWENELERIKTEEIADEGFLGLQVN